MATYLQRQKKRKERMFEWDKGTKTSRRHGAYEKSNGVVAERAKKREMLKRANL